MQKLVAGEISKGHDVAAALRELLSMEDFSHGCLEIFAPTIKGLIGISDNREIVAAQISNDGPTGLKALRLLLTVRSGRYAFREGYRVSGSQGLSIKIPDLEALIRSFNSAITGEMPETDGNAGDSSFEQGTSGSANQKTKKGIDAVARMKAAIQTRTGSFAAIQLDESISRPPAPPSLQDDRESSLEAESTPVAESTPTATETISKPDESAEGETRQQPIKSKTSTWSDLLSDNNVSSGRPRNQAGTSEASSVTSNKTPQGTETKAEFVTETTNPTSPKSAEPPQTPATPSNSEINAVTSQPTRDLAQSAASTKEPLSTAKTPQQTSSTTNGARTESAKNVEVAPASGSALPKAPLLKKSWAAEQLARRAATTRTGITGHNLPAMQAQNEKLTKTGDQAIIAAPTESKDAEAKALEASTVESADANEKGSPATVEATQSSEVKASVGQAVPETKSKLSDLKAKLSASSGKSPTATTKSASGDSKAAESDSKTSESDSNASDSIAELTNPRNTSNMLAALKTKPEPEKQREKDNDPKRTRTIEIHSAQATEKLAKERSRKSAKYAVGGIAAALFIVVVVCAGLFIDEQAKVVQVNALYDKNDHKGAVALADDALKLHPGSAKLLDGRGHSLEKLGRRKEALQDFENALAIAPNDLDILKHRAYGYLLNNRNQEALNDYNRLFQDKSYQRATLLRCRANAEMGLGRFADADKDMNAAARLGAATNDELLTQAICEARQGQYAKSEDKLKEIIKRDPNNSGAFLQRAVNFVALKKPKEAKETLNKLLAKHPTPEAYLRLAELARDEKHVPEQLENYSKYLSMRPHDIATLTSRAQVYLAMGQLEQALGDYNRIEKSNDVRNDANFFLQRAKVEMNAGKFDRAFNDLQKARALKPDDSWTNLQLAQAAEKSGNYSTAADAYSRVLAKDPNIFDVFLKRGNAYMLFKQYDLANTDFDKAIQIDPSNKQGYYRRGLSCFTQGLYDRAAVDFDQALRIDRNYAEARKLRAQIAKIKANHGEVASSEQNINLEPPEPDLKATQSERELIAKGYEQLKQGRYSSAIKYFVQVVKLNPNSAEGRRYLAFACVSDGRINTALEQFDALEKLHVLKDEDRIQFAEALFSAGRKREAASVWTALLVARPDDADIRVKLANTYLALNDMVRFQDVCKDGMKIAKSTEDYERLRSLLINTLKSRDQDQQAKDQQNTPKNRADAARIAG
jgi:tetratricopeptide (TPR) repeat protein